MTGLRSSGVTTYTFHVNEIESSVGWNSVVATLVIGPPRQGCMFAQSLGIVTLVTLAWIIVSLVAG
jgi:hypothetical protein